MSNQHFDVIIVGAGLSGIGACYHLQKNCPDKRYVLLEGREAIGGTWDLFRYPGVRSDSDMYTLGYKFKPWTHTKSIADGHTIRQYICDVARENGIDKNIRFGHKILRSFWSSADAQWTVEVQIIATGEVTTFSCNFLFMCTGYYNYNAGYTPHFEGRERFRGDIVHPQQWPENLDYSGKHVVVIGSGATAVTMVPAMTDKAAHVTMLQRSPSYVVSTPESDAIAIIMRKFLPESVVYRLTRIRNVGLNMFFYHLSRGKPKLAKRLLLSEVRKQVGPNVDMKHFTPHYNPWDERLCAVPNGDLFNVLRKGKASMVTDHIETFTENGIKLKSGQELQADIVITATGLDLQLMGGMELHVDGSPFRMADTVNYKGVMFKDLPNLAMIFGYTNASWTLKSDLSSEYVCRLLNHMDKHGYRQCLPLSEQEIEKAPFLNLSAGYIHRAADRFPRQGSKSPWKMYQNYMLDLTAMRLGAVDDGIMQFS